MRKPNGIACLGFLFIALFLSFGSCSKDRPIAEVITLTDDEAQTDAENIRESVSAHPYDGLELSLWASEKILGDPIAIHVDNSGRAWVTVTKRSNDSEFDIRGVDNSWRIESVKWESVEDRRNFLHRELAPDRSQKNTWIPDRNQDGSHDWRDLAVNKEEVWRLEDRSNDGLADFAQLFIRDFHDEVTDVAGAVLFHDDEVFIGAGPDMWRVRDTNSDGMADWKESISHGYNVHIGFSGHGMSGLKMGPDGRVYWGIGDMGFNVVDREGIHWYYPNTGAILRSEPDGRFFEVYAYGLRNTHEFDFDKHGNLISVDNDGDHPGEHERLVYLINGSDSGWRINWQFGKYDDPINNNYKVWMDEGYFKPRFDGQSAHILPPIAGYHAGPAGFAYNPGTALSEEWHDHFFVMSFRGSASNSPIYAFTLEESGASFKLASDREVLRGVLAVGFDFGPDGALYMTDWIQGWGKNNEGRIWKLDTSEQSKSDLRTETEELLSEDFTTRNNTELAGLLEHQDMRVRQKAQFELVSRNAISDLVTVINQSDDQLARIHGIWGVAQLGRIDSDAAEPLIAFLKDPDPEIRAQSAKMLGDLRYESAGSELTQLLDDEGKRVQLLAVEALGRISYSNSFDSIVDMIAANNDEDVYLRHAGAIALSRMGMEESVIRLADHPSRAVRIAAVVALKRLVSPGVSRFLEDSDEYVVTNAARAIMDDTFIDGAIADLAKMLDQNRFTNEPLLRRAINAALYSGTADDAERLAHFALRDDISIELRVEAIQTLEHWPEPSIFDRVTGRHRGEIFNEPAYAQEAVSLLTDQFLVSGQTDLRTALLSAIDNLGLKDAIPEILSFVHSDPSKEVRIVSLNTLMNLNYEHIDEVIANSLDDVDLDVRLNALRLLAGTDFPAELKIALLESTLEEGTAPEKRQAYDVLSRLHNPGATRLLLKELELLENDRLLQEVKLDLILALEQSESEELQNAVRLYESQKPEGDNLAKYEESLYGGSSQSGATIFFTDVAAQCIRCHVVNGDGADVGPELSTIADRLSREEMLLRMIDPSALPVSGYTMVTVKKVNDETMRGIYMGETDSELSLRINNDRVNISKAEISDRTHSLSAMPAMGELLSRSQIRDLIEYLSTLK